MKPSRLETACKVTLGPVAFPSPGIIPPGLCPYRSTRPLKFLMYPESSYCCPAAVK
jgi:hypothetical protein